MTCRVFPVVCCLAVISACTSSDLAKITPSPVTEIEPTMTFERALPTATARFEGSQWTPDATLVPLWVRDSGDATVTSLIQDLAKVYYHQDFPPEDVVPVLVGPETVRALLEGESAELYFDPKKPYEHLEIVCPALFQFAGAVPETTVPLARESFFCEKQLTIPYTANTLEPLYALFESTGTEFLLDGSEIEYSGEEGILIELRNDEREVLTESPGYHQVRKMLHVQVDDAALDHLAVEDYFEGKPTLIVEIHIENVVPTNEVILANGIAFGLDNPHILFDQPESLVPIHLPEVRPESVGGIVTEVWDTQTFYSAGSDFNVQDDGAGGSTLTLDTGRFAEGRYDQWVLVAPNYDSTNLQRATLATLSGINLAQEVKGIELGKTYQPDVFRRHIASELDKIRKLGANYVGISVSWFMPNPFANEVRPAPSTWEDGQFGLTHSESAIRLFVREVHDRGMRAHIALHLECDYWACWTGAISPSNRASWDEAYINYAVQMGSLAQELGAERLSITNELESMQRREDFMLRLIDQVRDVYDGSIIIKLSMWGDGGFGGYRNVPINVLQAVDYVGLNFYASGATNSEFTRAEMVRRMIPQMNSVADYYRGLGVNNLTITETGAAWISGAAIVPWEYRYPDSAMIDRQEQADYYAAYYQALDESRLGTMITGVAHWEWAIEWFGLEENTLDRNFVLSNAGNRLVHEVLAQQWNGIVP